MIGVLSAGLSTFSSVAYDGKTYLLATVHIKHFITASFAGAARMSFGVFDRIFAAPSGEGPKPQRIMIDAIHLKVHRTAASLIKKGMFPAVSDAQKAAWIQKFAQPLT